MITDQEFRQGISEYIRRISPAGSTLLGQVKSVDASEFTCTIQDDDPDSPVYEGVRLRPILRPAGSGSQFFLLSIVHCGIKRSDTHQ